MGRQKYFIILSIIVGIFLISFITDKNFRNKVLPDGNLIQETDPLDSDSLITPAPLPGTPQVEISTTQGKFTIELQPKLASKSVINYLKKWSAGYCNGKTFHRVEDWVVQGCDPKGNGTGGNDNLPTETSSAQFTAGAVGVARKAYPKDVSNDSQFFIVKKDSLFLNNDYTYLGRVISGMDVVNKLNVGDKIIETQILTK